MKTFEEQKAFVARLNLTDDMFFRHVFADRDVCEEVVRVLMKRPDLRLLEAHAQRDFTNLGSRSVTLDLYCEDERGNRISVEVQQPDDHDYAKRMRYIRACVDVGRTERGRDYIKLPDVRTIFITTSDPFGFGSMAYEVKRTLEHFDLPVPNGTHEIYLNTSCRDGSPIGRLMGYFAKSTVEGDARFPKLSDKVRLCKENESEVKRMCDAVEAYAQEYARKRVEEERESARKRIEEEREASKQPMTKDHRPDV